MLAVVKPQKDELIRIISDDLLSLVILSDEVGLCLDWISNIDTKLGINFHTICYVNKDFYIFTHKGYEEHIQHIADEYIAAFDQAKYQ